MATAEMLLSLLFFSVNAFPLQASVPTVQLLQWNPMVMRCRIVCSDIISPFDPDATKTSNVAKSGPVVGPLALTPENVELVLEEMRPYLLADGGNVKLRDIDGATVWVKPSHPI